MKNIFILLLILVTLSSCFRSKYYDHEVASLMEMGEVSVIDSLFTWDFQENCYVKDPIVVIKSKIYWPDRAVNGVVTYWVLSN
jgi:hypothetical protein